MAERFSLPASLIMVKQFNSTKQSAFNMAVSDNEHSDSESARTETPGASYS